MEKHVNIPGYRILKKLGSGGMATVYLAIQESFDRKVAIKVMSPQLAADPAFGDRFQREAKIVSQMNHPNIVTVYDVGVVDNHHYLAMQYVDGKELRNRIKDLSLMDKVKVVKDIASALNYAGNKGYVHRDVKPENVMLSDEDGRAVLMDFGIAKASDTNHSMTKTGMAIGTPYYMSPEQAQGKPVDRRSDIYSLGVMFFQLLAGRVPFDAESGVAIGIKHVTEPVPLLPKALRVFQPIMEKVMAKDPDKRYQTGADFIKDLDRISVADLDAVDTAVQQEIAEIANTDPNAQTTLGEVTPPILSNTGNVTTADAERLARRLAAPPVETPKPKGKSSPMVAIIVILLLAGGAGWYFSQQGNEPAPAVPVTTTVPATPAPAPQQPVASTTVSDKVEKQKQEDQAKIAQAEKDKQEEQARLVQAEKEKQDALNRAAQAEKDKRDALARIEQEKKKQEEAAKAADAERERARQEQQRAEQQRQQEVARAAQQKQQEIANRLSRANSLREDGKLVTPEGNNAVTAYRSVLEIDPNNEQAKQGLKAIENSFLIGIRSQIDDGNLDEAAGKLREAKTVFPDSAGINELLQLHQRKTAEALAAQAAKAEAARPRIARIVVSDADFHDMQTQQKASIPVNRTAYVGFSYENFTGATTLLQAVLYDSSRTVKIMQKPVVVTGAQGQAFFNLARPVEGFADGGYNIDLLLNDQKLVTAVFTVTH